MLDVIRATIEAHAMLRARDCVLVACSGGPDSLALLHVLHELSRPLDLELCIVHVDHGLRPDSAAEAEVVRAAAARLGRGFHAARVTVDPNLGGVQEAARNARYRCLEETADELGCRVIAVGHTRSDQAETVLHRLLRGAGLEGLGAIPPVRGRIVRPLIDVSRDQILAFLAERGVTAVHDPSNDQPVFLRVRVRHEVLPVLESLVPGVEQRLAALAADARAAHEALAILTQPWARPSVAAIRAAPRPVQALVIRQVLRELRGDLRELTRTHVEAALGLLEGDGGHAEVHLPGGALVRRGDVLTWDVSRGKKRGGEPPAS